MRIRLLWTTDGPRPAAGILAPAGWTVAAAAAAAVISWAATRTDARAPAAIAGLAAGAVLFVRADWLYFATIGLFFVNPSYLPPLVEAGPFKLRAVDVMFLLLALRLLFESAAKRRPVRLEPVARPVLLLLLWIGAGLARLAFRDPNLAPASAASYLRLIETFLVLPATTLLFASKRMFTRGARFLVFACGASVAAGAVGWVGSEADNWRVDGLLGVNSLGLVSGVLVLAGVCSARRLPRYAMTAAGLAGLLMTKSAGSLIATTVCLSLAWAGRRFSGRTLVVLVVAPAVIFAGLLLTRWDDTVGVLDLTGGSFAHRLYLANLALRLFAAHPLAGVGWQASATSEVVGNAKINADLRERYWRLPNYLFADVSPTSVHNMYLHLLVELGAPGMLLVILAGARLRRECRRAALEAEAAGGQLRAEAGFLSLGLLFISIWWNSNPLYPGQVETVLFMAFAGLLPAVGRAAGRSPAP